MWQRLGTGKVVFITECTSCYDKNINNTWIDIHHEMNVTNLSIRCMEVLKYLVH